MVKRVVVAGGAGDIGGEVVDCLVAKGHNVTVLTRKDVTNTEADGFTLVKADYSDKASLVELLKDIDVVLSFVNVSLDKGNVAQKNLIDACIEAGVKRFAPSEWSARSNSGRPTYAGKDQIREYLENLNKDRKVLEYTLFQQGVNINYFSHPYKLTKHLTTFEMMVDVANCRAIIPGNGDQLVTFTDVVDLGHVVAEAIDYPGEWPVVGGVRGEDLTLVEFVRIAEKVRGRPFKVESVEPSDLTKGVLKTSWVPKLEHPSVPKEKIPEVSVLSTCSTLEMIDRGVWHVSDEWNQRLPDFKFTTVEEYLKRAFDGKP